MARRILILLMLCGVTIGPGDLSSCVFFPETVFTTKLGPIDAGRFFAGQLDILQPHYQRIYLMAAYRYLEGIGLSKPDQQALAAKPDGGFFNPWNDQGSPAVEAWLAARIQVGAPRLDRIDRFRSLPDQVFILNCGDDAFRNAAATLVERGRAGAAHEDLRAWVAAQDQVFANCSSPQRPSIPAALAEGAASWMQADRAYQIAAAEFYAGQFDQAAKDFLRIAGDRASPWHPIAGYLAARALIRKATVDDATAAPAAQEQLSKVLADPDAAPWHASARGLSLYLRTRTEPERAVHELAQTVATGKSDVAGAMNDYRLMLDRTLDRGKEPSRDDEITDWIVTMQNGPADHALAKWRATRSMPWLAAAMTYASHPEPDLMAAAAAVDRSPTSLTIEFQRLRLMTPAEVRRGTEQILSRKMSATDRNLFLAERMRVARDWNDWLRYAPRTAVATFEEGLGEEPDTKGRRYFDEDAARILNYQAPLALLRQAAVSSHLPPNLQLQVTRTAWVRAVLLDDPGSATEMAKLLEPLAPYLKPYLEAYLTAADPRAREFAAVWMMLNNPGMQPAVYIGEGRTSSIPLLDNFRDNWWCTADPPHGPMNAPLDLLYQGAAPDARFLTAAQRSQAQEEQKRFTAAPPAPTFLARKTVAWAEAHPDDAQVPEALHLVVRVGHYACGGDSQSDEWQKRAFRLLHSRYGKSKAAQLTPFWYSVGAR